MLGSAALVAVIITFVDEATLGAVNIPVEETLPFDADQVTAAFEVLLTVAENCCVLPEATWMDVGDTEIPTEGGVAGGLTITEVAADLLASAILVACTMTFIAEVTFGAVNIPLVEILPAEDDQATAVFEVLLTVAENCCAPSEFTVGPRGEMLTPMGEPESCVPVAMLSERVASPRSPCGRSVTSTRKLNNPALRGLPASSPFLRNDNPGGKLPLTR